MRAKHFTITHSARLVIALGWSDFVLKYRGSVLGYLWSLLVPLSRFIVILIVLRPFVAHGDPSYPLALLLGLLFWDFFSGATNACIATLREKSDLIQRIAFPRIIIELSAIWTQTIVILCHVSLFILLAWSMGIPPSLRTLVMIPILFSGALLSLGIGAMLASISLKYRDIPHLWQSVLQIFFWLTPVAYPASSLTHALQELHILPLSVRTTLTNIMTVQPLSVFIESARSALLHSALPGTTNIVIACIISVLCATIGIMLFVTRSSHFLEEL
jgi:ABC-2 type transport system permease protein